MVANLKSHAISQMAYDWAQSPVWETAYTQALNKRVQRRKFALVKLPIAPVGNKKSTTGASGATIYCQNAPVATRHKDIIITEILTFAVNFPSGVILLVFIINAKENRSLCVHTLLCSDNIELYLANCPWLIPNPREPGAILKCKLPLVPAGLFQLRLAYTVKGLYQRVPRTRRQLKI